MKSSRVTSTVAWIVVCGLLMGCGPNRIDGSSKEAYDTSVEAMAKSLNKKQQDDFASALIEVALEDSNVFALAASGSAGETAIRSRLDGLTYEEVLSKAESIRIKREQEEIAKAEEAERQQASLHAEQERQRVAAREERLNQIMSEIKEIEQAKRDAAEAEAVLKKFAVIRSRFYYSTGSFSSDPVIEITVKNGLPVPVSRAYFRGVVTSPGRSVPWVDETFNYSIPGGVEPNESPTWKLQPNSFSDWGKAPKDRKDLVLTVSLNRVDGPNGEALYDAEFSERKEKRLKSLKEALLSDDV